VPLEHGLVPQPGPCFATQFVEGSSWDGRGALLDALEHPEHIPGLVVLDTWLRNPDRYLVRAGRTRKNLRNVFLREGGVPRGLFRLLAQTNEIDDLVRRTPKQWLPDGQVRQDLPGFLKRRATHVATDIESWLATECRWDQSAPSDQ
jgi:pimeloyl-ACP methyl ester carboxylesterase